MLAGTAAFFDGHRNPSGVKPVCGVSQAVPSTTTVTARQLSPLTANAGTASRCRPKFSLTYEMRRIILFTYIKHHVIRGIPALPRRDQVPAGAPTGTAGTVRTFETGWRRDLKNMSARVITPLLVAVTTSMALVLLLSTPAWAGVRQVGAYVWDPEGYFRNATAVRTRITQPTLPQSSAGDGAYVYLWIGTYLPDGSFYQAGTATNSAECGEQLGTFAWGFDPAGNTTMSTFASCGLTGTHTFDLRFQQVNPNGTSDWLSFMDSNAIPGSRFNTLSTNVGSERPYVISETSRNAAGEPDPDNDMGPVFYLGGPQALVGGQWRTAKAAASFYYTNTAVGQCPPLNVKSFVDNEVQAGAPMPGPCTPDNQFLWDYR